MHYRELLEIYNNLYRQLYYVKGIKNTVSLKELKRTGMWKKKVQF